MRILLVDDEALQRDMLRGFLKNQGYTVAGAEDGPSALRLFQEKAFQLVLLDHRMPGMTGDTLLREIKALNPTVRSIMITAHASVDTAVRVMKLGADDFLEKPVDLTALLEKIQKLEENLLIEEESGEVSDMAAAAPLPLTLIGQSPPMQALLSMVGRIAPTSWTALISGETGTGKERIARLVHMLSPRRDAPFIEVNCAAIPENLFESEIFGHEKGAFTGAVSRRRGRFELADKGTLFLDEVGELPLLLQAKLLRTLQENRLTRVGSETDLAIDVRVLAATNRDLKDMVLQGRFREDLYYRLNVLELKIPPLRQRREDIPELCTFFLERYGLRPISFHPDAMATLIKYSFPGNVRELEHMIQRIVTLVRGSLIRPQDLPHEVRFQASEQKGALEERLEAMEREMLTEALEASGWVQTRAAESLGISERVLRYKMKKFSLQKTG
ncbi:sigma-54 dependent transcriptional regulator [Desulfobotulus sp.]|jgi:two-component system response regulator AtoC|uniref:sigma-54-dependent transcriptional regulator n=1 Tax=Desulfobotulus sp. TaxID=1940337 RepID=UPI002A36DB70|nr:sigma-54 dependent transcriptional regulator [Desulfobotulus sp.]MDY0163586.1 sigma-54 dependent transcriptional regulator [Desulfobotulus sp.]